MNKQFQQWAFIGFILGSLVNPLLAQNANTTQLLETFQVLEINSEVAVELIKCKPKQERIVWGADTKEADQSFFQLNNGKLSVQPPPQAQPITIYYTQLDVLIVNAAQAQVFANKPIKSRFIFITFNGGGNLTIPCKSNEAHVTMNGDGQAYFSLQTKRQTVTINGSATAVLKGKTQSQHITLNGSGEVQSGELKAKSGGVMLNGSGVIEVKTKQKLIATLNGSGKIYQKGKGKTIESLNGSGTIHSSQKP